MKITVLQSERVKITLDVSLIASISGIDHISGTFQLTTVSGDKYDILASEYGVVQAVIGTAGGGGGGESSEYTGMEVIETTERVLTLLANKYYIFGECVSLDISIGSATTDGKLNEYIFEFNSGATPTVLTLPSTVTPSSLNIQSNTKYVISIKNNVLTELGALYDNTDSFIRNLFNKSITSIVIPEGVTTIPQYMFYQCRSLVSVTLPSTLRDIGNYAFYLCNALSQINFPPNLTTIGLYAFSGCTSLSNLTFPEGFTTINNRAFEGCSSLTLILLPSTITYIGLYSFVNCTSLLAPTFPNSLTTMDSYSFLGCRSLSTVVLPNRLPSLWSYTFSSCSALTSVTIPNTVTIIGTSCFYNCGGLASIELPNSIATILLTAFLNCSALKEIQMYDSVTAITGTNVFSGINTGCRVRIIGTNRVIPFMTAIPATVSFYVDPTMVQAYKTNSAWSARASYIFSLNDY